jgi:hypothetical protein
LVPGGPIHRAVNCACSPAIVMLVATILSLTGVAFTKFTLHIQLTVPVSWISPTTRRVATCVWSACCKLMVPPANLPPHSAGENDEHRGKRADNRPAHPEILCNGNVGKVPCKCRPQGAYFNIASGKAPRTLRCLASRETWDFAPFFFDRRRSNACCPAIHVQGRARCRFCQAREQAQGFHHGTTVINQRPRKAKPRRGVHLGRQ